MPTRPESEASREQLAEARDAVRRQIGILDGGSDLWGFRTNSGGAAATKLREVLAELNEGLAEAEGGISDVQIPDNAASQSHRPRQRLHLQRDDLKIMLPVAALLVVFLLCTVFSPLVAPILAPLLPQSITQPHFSHFNWGFDQKWICNNQSVDVTCLRKR